VKRIGRYVLHDEIAAGGMGAVHLGHALGDAGFARIVAVKRLHSHVASVPGALVMFMDEARLSARVRHPNVVATLDVIDHEGEMLLVMEYVHGAPLALLSRLAKSAGAPIPVGISVAVTLDVLGGLQAAHEATDERGQPLFIVHRDVSPQNILVGADGNARLLDFGIAKAASRVQTTRDGHLKGKLRYMAPEQISHQEASPRSDAYSAAVVLYELLTGTSLFDASNEGTILARVLEGVVIPPRRYVESIGPALDAFVMRGLSRNPEERFASCREMASALRSAATPADAEAVSRWVKTLAGKTLDERAARVARIESGLARDEPGSTEAGELRTRTVVSLLAAPPASPLLRGRGALVLLFGATMTFAAVTAIVAHERATPTHVAPRLYDTARSSAPLLGSAPSEPLAQTSAAAVIPPIPPRAARITPRARPSVSATPRPHAGCNPMFTVDENGIRRVKPECL
jgi:serine/threonine protein kinase